MEPKLPTPERSHDYTPGEQRIDFGSLEQTKTPETGLEQGERPFEQRSEASPVAAPPVLPTPVAVPAPSVPVTPQVSPAADDGTPAIAGDDDLIEKEWVDKAKKIIADTRDDPFRREKEVGKLQADYLRKRYGKELGAAD